MYNGISNILIINKNKCATTAQQIHNKIIVVADKHNGTNICCRFVDYVNN